jgi:hypothetical protein
MAAAIVLHDLADVLGDGAEVLDEVFGALGGKFGVLIDGSVEVGDVGLVVLIVVQLHGCFVDVGFESCVGVRKRGKFVGHGIFSCR